MKIDNDDLTAFAGTAILHFIALLLLYFTVLRTLVPVDDGGVPVVFGDLYTSVGSYQPPATPVQPQKQTPTQTTTVPVPKTEEKLITQNKVETVSIPDQKKENEKKIAEENAKKVKEREEAERKRKEEDERKRKEAELRKQQEKSINDLASNAFGVGSSQENRQGTGTSGTTNQGSPFGNSETGLSEGTGGFGSFNLKGRSLGSAGLPRPDYTAQEEGRIVIDIVVDPDGNVINAKIGQGTNIDNQSLRNSALAAAKRAKFNKIQSANNQNGTITYNYKFT